MGTRKILIHFCFMSIGFLLKKVHFEWKSCFDIYEVFNWCSETWLSFYVVIVIVYIGILKKINCKFYYSANIFFIVKFYPFSWLLKKIIILIFVGRSVVLMVSGSLLPWKEMKGTFTSLQRTPVVLFSELCHTHYSDVLYPHFLGVWCCWVMCLLHMLISIS